MPGMFPPRDRNLLDLIPAQNIIHLPDAFRKTTRWTALCLVEPSSLDNNPRNWKSHPPTQMDAAMEAIKRVGFHQPLLYNLTTGRLLDGHGRKAKCEKEGIPLVPVAMGSWSEEDENFILHSTDTIGSMYRIDAERYKSLTNLVKKNEEALGNLRSNSALSRLHTGAESLARHIESGDREATPLPIAIMAERKKRKSVPVDADEDSLADTPEVVETTILDAVDFPGDPVWNIPSLLPELLCTPDMVPDKVFDRTPDSVSEHSWYCISAEPWREREEQQVEGGILGCFCEDYHLDGFYDNGGDYIEKLQSLKLSSLCLPDYSTYSEWPFARKLWSLYRSRWVGRYWQASGLNVLPVLQSVHLELTDDDVFDIAVDTLALDKPPVVACQCRTIKQQGGSFEDFGQWLKIQVESIRPEVVIIYGGSEHFSKFDGYLVDSVKVGKRRRRVRYVYLPSYMANRRKLMKRK